MDFLAHIQMIRVPIWARIIIYGGFACLLAMCAYLGWHAILSKAPDSWLAAATALFAAIFPLMVVILIAGTAQAGVGALIQRSDQFLTDTLPQALVRIVENRATFTPGTKLRSQRRTEFASLQTSHRRTDCYADYRIGFRDDAGRPLSVVIRVELNVRRLNFNLYLPCNRLNALLPAQDRAAPGDIDLTAVRTNIFPHTLDAAGALTNPDHGAGEPGIYVFHRKILSRTLDGETWHVVVGSSRLAPDFLWNPAERLYVAQDLMFMVRAFAAEGADLFAEA